MSADPQGGAAPVEAVLETHSVLPPRPPARRWVITRYCGCGECRFYSGSRICSRQDKLLPLYSLEPR